MPSSIFCAPGWRGVCCRTTCRLGRRSITICAAGSARASGIGSITRSSWPTASAPAARPARLPPSSTANRSRRLIKRGIKGLRCGQEDQRAQAPHPDRHRWTAAHREGPFRRHPDRDGGKTVLKASRARYPFVTRAFADGGYAGRLVRWAKDKAHIVVEVVKRSPAAKGFKVLRRRWVVERTFAWIVKNRRFVRDYEQLTAVAETLIIVAATATLIRRWP